MKRMGIYTIFVAISLINPCILGFSTTEYHGVIREDAVSGSQVELDIPLEIHNRGEMVGIEVCGYTVYKYEDSLPFKVILLNRTSGAAQIVLDGDNVLSYEKKAVYNFQVAAHDCASGNHAVRETVHIQVQQAEKPIDDPQQQTYTIAVEEDKLYSDILQLEIEETDKTPQGDKKVVSPTICKFRIATPNVPFVIENKGRVGVLRNTERLYYAIQHNYILEVKAEDCGGKAGRSSSPLIINIKVTPLCHSGWTGHKTRLDYTPGDGIIPFAELAHLKICDDSCQVEEVNVRVKLSTDRSNKGCEKDAASIGAQRNSCGVTGQAVDLLPNPVNDIWSQQAPVITDDQDVFSFDGKSNAIEVLASKFNSTLGKSFTLMMWMKHEDDKVRNEQKEQILCNADGEGKNRHHYSVFVHHCKFILLLRQEYYEGVNYNSFWPAEWRWKAPQVCDGLWHQYTVVVDRPEATLYIDGMKFVESEENVDVVDDWALHQTDLVHFTKLMIGACWMGGEQHLTQFFKGLLAGISVMQDTVLSEKAIRCMSDCHEKLDFRAMSAMENNMSVAFNSELSEISIQGHTVPGVETLVQKIGYLNSHLYPKTGHRSIEISTSVSCSGGLHRALPLATVEIDVLPSAPPALAIEGTTSIVRNEDDVGHGILIFPDLRIAPKQETSHALGFLDSDSGIPELLPLPATGTAMTLDSCMINVDPAMNFNDFNKERLVYPENLLGTLVMEAYQSKEGLVISGAEKMENYEKILRQIRYANSLPQHLSIKTFTLTCSQLNGRFTTNDLKVKLDILHPSLDPVPHDEAPAQHIQNAAHVQPVKTFSYSQNSIQDHGLGRTGGAAGTGIGIVVIIVICVGFLLFMVVLGVMRLKSTNHRSSRDVGMDDKPEMEWDNSALTITVNPMEQQDVCDDEIAGVHCDDSDSDDESNYHDDQDEVDSSEDEVAIPKGRGLEWDESDLSKYQCKV